MPRAYERGHMTVPMLFSLPRSKMLVPDDVCCMVAALHFLAAL